MHATCQEREAIVIKNAAKKKVKHPWRMWQEHAKKPINYRPYDEVKTAFRGCKKVNRA